MNNRYYLMQKNMVEYQIKSRGINNSSILDVFLKVPRHQFVNEEVREYAYQDHPLGIGYNQTISQPYIVAFMIDYLDIKDTDKVLEIGTGSGYQTAILAELAYKVFTLEIVKPLQDKAKKILTELNYNNIYYSNHSGFDGWIEHAAFDKIIVSAAPNKLPDHLVDQLKIGGRMILPIGEGWFQRLYLIIKHQNSIEKIKLDSVRFVPMIEK